MKEEDAGTIGVTFTFGRGVAPHMRVWVVGQGIAAEVPITAEMVAAVRMAGTPEAVRCADAWARFFDGEISEDHLKAALAGIDPIPFVEAVLEWQSFESGGNRVAAICSRLILATIDP